VASLLFLGLFLSQINAFDLYTRQFATVADRAVITFAPLVFERDHFLVLALFENFSGHLCSRDERVAVSHVFSIGKQQYITKRGGFARFDIEKIDIDGVAFRDAKLPATSSDDCVSHSFSGEKKPPTIPHPSALGKRKAWRRTVGISAKGAISSPALGTAQGKFRADFRAEGANQSHW
jgi:hypothetical protein